MLIIVIFKRLTDAKLWKTIIDYRLNTVYYVFMKLKPDTLTKAMNRGGRDYPRELARQRDKRTCQMCGKLWIVGTRRFDIHHIIGCGSKSLDYDRVADLDNLITYCHKCHLNLHSVRLKMSTKTGMQKHARHKSKYYKKDTKKAP